MTWGRNEATFAATPLFLQRHTSTNLTEEDFATASFGPKVIMYDAAHDRPQYAVICSVGGGGIISSTAGQTERVGEDDGDILTVWTDENEGDRTPTNVSLLPPNRQTYHMKREDGSVPMLAVDESTGAELQVIMPGKESEDPSSPNLLPVLMQLENMLCDPGRTAEQQQADRGLLLTRTTFGPHSAEPPTWVSNSLDALSTVLPSHVDIQGLISHPTFRETWKFSTDDWQMSNFIAISERHPRIAVHARMDLEGGSSERWTTWIRTEKDGWALSSHPSEVDFSELPYLVGGWLLPEYKSKATYANHIQELHVAGTGYWDTILRELHGGDSIYDDCL